MEFTFGLILGFGAALLIGWFTMEADGEKCAKRHNVYACELHKEWRPIQNKN